LYCNLTYSLIHSRYISIIPYVFHFNCRSFQDFRKRPCQECHIAYFTVLFYSFGDPLPDFGFYTFARDPYETCRGHRDEKVEKRVQVAKIYGETGNTWAWSRLIVFLHRLRHIYFIARETDRVLISLWHTKDDR